MKAMKVYYVDNEEVKQVEMIVPSKRSVTKTFEVEEKEVLKMVDVTKEYEFTLEDIKEVKGLTEKQKKMLDYILMEAGIPKYKEEEETEEE